MTPTTPSAPDEVVLVNCPFCGSPGRISYSDRGETFSVRCVNWGAPTTACMGSGAYAYTEAEAIAAWNRRAPPQPAGVSAEGIEELAAKVADEIAAAVMGNDHLVHLLDEQQADEVHGDIQIEAVRRIRAALEAVRLPSPTDTREAVLEEAARVADDELSDNNETSDYDDGYRDACQNLAAAIRALKSKPTEAPVEDGWPVIVDGDKRYAVPPDKFSVLMGHGLLGSRSDGTYRLSDSEELKADPGSAGVNNPKPLAVLAVVRAALAAAESRAAEAEKSASAARQNFHTMQLAANDLRIRAEAAEARTDALEHRSLAEGWSLCADGVPAAITLLVARWDEDEWVYGVAESYMIGEEPASVPRWTHWRYLPQPPEAK